MRTSADRSAELSKVFTERSLARVKQDFTDEVAQAFDLAPLGPHDDRTTRVLRALRNLPVAGKHIIVSLGADGPWRIGVITLGQPGNLAVQPAVFVNYEDAMRKVFALRRDQFMQGNA